MAWTKVQWRKSAQELEGYLQPLALELGRSERRVAFSRYVTGLLVPGERKSITPMAERLGADSQILQQFLSDSPWEEELLWRALRQVSTSHVFPDRRKLCGLPPRSIEAGHRENRVSKDGGSIRPLLQR